MECGLECHTVRSHWQTTQENEAGNQPWNAVQGSCAGNLVSRSRWNTLQGNCAESLARRSLWGSQIGGISRSGGIAQLERIAPIGRIAQIAYCLSAQLRAYPQAFYTCQHCQTSYPATDSRAYCRGQHCRELPDVDSEPTATSSTLLPSPQGRRDPLFLYPMSGWGMGLQCPLLRSACEAS